jgi:hypothetical protein
MITKILAGVALSLGLALAGTGYWLSNVIASRATVRASLNSALEANASLIEDRARARAEAARNREISAAALKDTADLNSKIAAIRERIRHGEACRIDPADADALDRLFR